MMRKHHYAHHSIWAISLSLTVLLVAAHRKAAAETIVFIRHGEKPSAGLGQLSCQGLNRALKLPGVLSRMFGAPDAVFAPNPSIKKDDGVRPFDYVRPLATIEPTAVRYGLPVNTGIGFDNTVDLVSALSSRKYVDDTVIVAWEHYQIVDVATKMLQAHHADANMVPEWKVSDFDSIYVIRINRIGEATFERREEHLNDLPVTCPD